MPRVPKSRRQVFEGVTAVRSNVEAPAEAFGGGRVVDIERRGINNVARAAKDIAKTMDDFDKTEVKRARRELQEFADEQHTRFSLLKNKDPSIQRTQYDDEYEKKYQELTKGLGNDNQKTLFFDVKDQLDVGRKRVLGKHQLSEAHNYQNDEDMATIASEADIAANNYEDRTVIANSLNSQAQTYLDYAARNGLANKDEKTGKITLTEEGKEGLKKELSNTHIAVIKRAINEGQDKKAKEYFESIKDSPELDGKKKDQMLKLVESSSKLGEAQRFTDMVMTQEMNMGDALAEARKKYEGEQEEVVVRSIKNRFAEKDRVEKEIKQNAYEGIMSNLEGKKGVLNLSDETAYDDLPHSMRKAARDYQKALLAGSPIQTNWKLYTSLKTDMFREDAQGKAALKKFMDEGPWQYRPYLSDTHYSEMLNLWKSTKDTGKKGSEALFSARATNQMITRGIKDIGLDPTNRDNTSATKTQINSYYQYVDEKRIAWESENGKKIPPEVLQTIVDTATLREVDNFFNRKDGRYNFELQADEAINVDMSKISPSAKRRAIDSLRRKGIPTTDGNILKEIQTVKRFR